MILAGPTSEGGAGPSTRSRGSGAWPWLILIGVFAAALTLRLWGIDHGLPSVYNPDEAAHFVPRAVDFVLTGDRNPDYVINPPLITYLLWVVYEVWFGGAAGLADTLVTDPSAPFLVGRVVVALIGAVGSASMFLVGRHLFDNRVGLVAAVLMAVAFLPVHWSHFATNDVAAMVAASVSLIGTAWILKGGGLNAYVLSGAGLGVATGTKYTAGIMLIPLLTAFIVRWREVRRAATIGLLVACAGAIVTFLLAVPPLVFDLENSLEDLRRLTLPGEGDPKIGQAHETGYLYYPWVLTWGLGWLACAACVWGALRLALLRPRVGWTLLPTPLLYIAFMGGQPTFFGRWLLPVLPIIIVAAAFGLADAARFAAQHLGWSTAPVLAAFTVLICAQSLIHVAHMNSALGRTDTRAMAADWVAANIPSGAGFVNQGVFVTPLLDLDAGTEGIQNRWEIVNHRSGEAVGARAEWLDQYEARGVCWVSASSLYYDRVFLDEQLVPRSAEYYRQLEALGQMVFQATPYRDGAKPVPFNFDWATNLYPFAFERPGGEVVIYRLRGGSCA